MLSVLAAIMMQMAPPAASPDADPNLRYYPERALAERVEGIATLDCAVTPDGALKNCVVAAEDPAGWGFGAKALKLSALFHMKPAENRVARSARVQVPIRFKLPAGSGPPERDPGRGPLP